MDPNRIYLGGHSTGGTLVLLVAECSERFRAVFSVEPGESVAGYGEAFLPFDFSNPRELELRSPILWLHSIKRPTFVFGAEEDCGAAVKAMEAKSENELVHFLVAEDEDHGSILRP